MNNIDQLVANNSAFSSFEELLNAPGYRPSCDMSNPAMRAIADAYDKAQEERGDERRAYRFGEAKVEAKAKVETKFVVMHNTRKVAVLEVRKGWRKPDRIAERAIGVVSMPYMRLISKNRAGTLEHLLNNARELAEAWNAEGGAA